MSPQAVPEAVGQELQGVDGAAVGGAEGHQPPGDVPAVVELQEDPGDDPPHGVPHQDQPSLRVAAPLPPRLQRRPHHSLQIPRRHPGIPPPVVGEFQVVPPLLQVVALEQGAPQPGVAVDLPVQPGKDVEVRHQGGGGDPVVQVVQGVVVPVQGQIPDAPPQGEGRPEGRAGAGSPDGLAVALKDGTPDPGDHHHEIGHGMGHGGLLDGELGGNRGRWEPGPGCNGTCSAHSAHPEGRSAMVLFRRLRIGFPADSSPPGIPQRFVFRSIQRPVSTTPVTLSAVPPAMRNRTRMSQRGRFPSSPGKSKECSPW
jgi:hypothetical protein